jgi:hypothetical protein
MKAVDFIVELGDRTYFIELKDPDAPSNDSKHAEEFISSFLSFKLDSDLKTKYRDTYLFELASDRIDKPIYYLVLIAANTLTSADLLNRSEALKRILPVGKAGKGWQKAIVADCAVMNLLAWNRQFPTYPLTRISSNSVQAKLARNGGTKDNAFGATPLRDELE